MKKILIADDSLFMRMSLNNNLPDGHEVIEADSGAKAIEQFKSQKPDLVLLDIVMPESEQEGVRVLRQIMEIDSKAQVVMITAVGQDAIIEECKKLGARDYIIKPFDEQQIAEIVQKCLSEEVIASSE